MEPVDEAETVRGGVRRRACFPGGADLRGSWDDAVPGECGGTDLLCEDSGVLLLSVEELYMDCGRLDMAAEVADFMRLNYPGWENNAYLKRELFAKKLLGRLIQAKMWKTIQFLTKRKRTRN